MTVLKYVESPTKSKEELYVENAENRIIRNKMSYPDKELGFFYDAINFSNVEINPQVVEKIVAFEPKQFVFEIEAQHHFKKYLKELCAIESECEPENGRKKMDDADKPDVVAYSKTICSQNPGILCVK